MEWGSNKLKSILGILITSPAVLATACRPVASSSHILDQAESREEAYVRSDSIAAFSEGQLFQLRLRGNSEQCVVPFLDQLNPRQCDGKAHWRVVWKKPNDSSIVRIQHTVAPVCIAAENGQIKFALKSGENGDVDCNESRFDLRFDGRLVDAQGKKLVYLPTPGQPAEQQEMELWIPVESRDPDQMIKTWNLDVNYGPAFLLPNRKAEQMVYQSDGWSSSNRRWLSTIFVYSDREKTRIKGLKSIYTDGTNDTTNSVGACDGNIADAGCALLDIIEVGEAPKEALSAEKLAEKYNFLTGLTVIHNGDYIVGLKFSTNKKDDKVIMAPNADRSKFVEQAVKFAFARSDQVISGFYGAYGQTDKNISSAYLKDLGIIAGRYQTYAQAWQDETTGQGDNRLLIRKSENPVDPFGPTTIPAITDQGYFETVAATDSANRHWISSIELFSGAGFNEFVTNGPANMLIAETNDVIGMKVHHSLTKENATSSSHELLVGYNLQSKQPSPVIDFGEYEYLSKVEYRTIAHEYDEKLADGATSQANYLFRPTAGIAALRFTLSNIKNTNQRVIAWDAADPDHQNPAVARTTKKSWSSRSQYSDWIDLGSGQDRAIVGFYGISNTVQNPTFQKDERYVPAIKTLGLITTTVGCAFRYKTFTQDIDAIRALGKVALENIGNDVRVRCAPPSKKN